MNTKRYLGALAMMLFSIAANAMGPDSINNLSFLANDPPGNFFPGKYFEAKAHFYLRKHDYVEALRLFELAGFWGNKVAQYNAGLMYFNGLGVPQDRIRGTAWLGIAAEKHGDLADAMLQSAYAKLDVDERKQADGIWRQLDETYGDAVTIKRAVKRYDAETRTHVGSRLGFLGNVSIYEPGPGGAGNSFGSDFSAREKQQLDALIGKIQGTVTVGAVTPLPVDARKQPTATQP